MRETTPHGGSARALFIAWLAAVLLFLAFFAWAFAALRGPGPKPPEARARTDPHAAPVADPRGPARPYGFDADSAPYAVVAFSRQGMRLVDDADPFFQLLPPGNVLTAQVVRRGPVPEPVTRGIRVRYELDPQTQTGSAASARGEFIAREHDFVSPPLAVLPYTRNGTFNPYPLARIEVVDERGSVVAATLAVVPTSTEMGCRNCHGGPWKRDGRGGVSERTARHILAAHDKYNATQLAHRAGSDGPADCRACHDADPEHLALSTAVHGFHATMGLHGGEACGACHPSADSGATRFFRDIHATWQLDCTRCHGDMSDHALSLLKADAGDGKVAAQRRMLQLTPVTASGVDAIRPRRPWVNLPDCTACHDFSKKPDPTAASAFNLWTDSEDGLFSRRTGNTGMVRCGSCHGSPHAVYPATGVLGDDRDNIQPLQYQNLAMPLGSDNNCGVCHMQPMVYSAHHPLPDE